jgi:transcription initiation factor TFIIE subunit beta
VTPRYSQTQTKAFMSKLAQDSAAFKNVLKRQDYTSWHSQPTATTSTEPEPAADPDYVPSKKKARPKSSAVHTSMVFVPTDEAY